MSKIAPSILSADFCRLGEQLASMESEGVSTLHIDVMDGMFVPSISFGMPVMASIKKSTHMLFDVHLMIVEPKRYLKEFVEAGADSITVHAEACEDLRETLELMKQYPIKRAVSLKPTTPISEIAPYLGELDMVLIMSVEPGFGGQKLIPETLDKIKQLVELRKERDYQYQIQIDGGITKENAAEIAKCGADILVAGTAVFKGSIAQNLQYFKENL